MKLLIICSSYPATPSDASGTAGLFIRDFALVLHRLGHQVVVQPVARKRSYVSDPELTIEPMPWWGGDRELASLNLLNPINWLRLIHFFLAGRRKTLQTLERHGVQHVLALWVVPAGIFGLIARRARNVPYDVWALGSDIWKIRKIPLVGEMILRTVIVDAEGVYADGKELCREVEEVSGRICDFLPSSRKLPPPRLGLKPLQPEGRTQLLFVGRYHHNKGPDVMLQAIALLPDAVRDRVFLRMFGLGPLEEDLRLRQRQLGLSGVTQIGGPIEAQDFSDYLSRTDFVVIPSRIDSIPLVFSDALQGNTPVIATPVGDLGEIIEKHKCGELAREATADALAHAIQRAVTNGAAAYSKRIGEALQMFDVDRSAKRWLACLTDPDRADAKR